MGEGATRLISAAADAIAVQTVCLGGVLVGSCSAREETGALITHDAGLTWTPRAASRRRGPTARGAGIWAPRSWSTRRGLAGRIPSSPAAHPSRAGVLYAALAADGVFVDDSGGL